MASPAFPELAVIRDISSISFNPPVKKINSGEDLSHFFHSKAYHDIMSFLLQLNRSMFPSSTTTDSGSPSTQTWEVNSPNIKYPDPVSNLRDLLSTLKSLIDSAPPDPGPRRFGNISFRRWHELVTTRIPQVFSQHLPNLPPASHEELVPYLLGAFGSPQRLDYGSGHELSFLAFLGCLWKLSFFHPPTSTSPSTPSISRAIVTGILGPYFSLIRTLITTYTLEPAGSHGVWGLDDHSFLPYIFGSAQLGPQLASPTTSPTPTEGSLRRSPDQSDVVNAAKTARWRETNMYFAAIAFIHEVKKGPFWEHSPMLYDISGVSGGWAKINKGMVKMYVAEVLGKFPVVQHFPFGGLFSWDLDPESGDLGSGTRGGASGERNVHFVNQLGSRAASAADSGGGTKAPWASGVPAGGGTKAPWATGTAGAGMPMDGTRAPWAAAAQAPRGPPAMKASDRERLLRGTGSERGKDNDAGRMGPPARFASKEGGERN